MAPYELHPLISALVDDSTQGLRNLAALLQVHSVHHTIRHDPRFGPPHGYGFFTQDQLLVHLLLRLNGCYPGYAFCWNTVPR